MEGGRDSRSVRVLDGTMGMRRYKGKRRGQGRNSGCLESCELRFCDLISVLKGMNSCRLICLMKEMW